MNAKQQIILHKTGTMTYWSVTSQQWRMKTYHISDQDLAALPHKERERAIRHQAQHGESASH